MTIKEYVWQSVYADIAVRNVGNLSLSPEETGIEETVDGHHEISRKS